MKIHFLIGLTLLFFLLLASCSEKDEPEHSPASFQLLDAETTGITFKNQLNETDSLNILTYLYYYNGGGVAIGDINNDGLPDIYLSGNDVENKLYLNIGNMQFSDITATAGVSCKNAWNTGVTFVDINSDGFLDLYVCQVDGITRRRGRNQLFINSGDKTFIESAQKYGLDFSGLATHAAFLDYDRDGDLDCYLLNHSLKDPEQFKPAAITRKTSDDISGDRLLQNQNGYYVDVSAKAGILRSSIGFGLGIDIADLNRDGWPDIYIGNDFHENDYLYLNNRDGTFREVITEATGHTSNFTMGVSIADINNDARPDILSLDMKPEDETTYKLAGGWESYNIYEFKRSFGYHHQSPRNALQINSGMNGGIPVFTEVACLYGIEATDWSWSPLLADFNNDGFKDVFISNGIERRPNDMDFVNHYNKGNTDAENIEAELINIMPPGKASNYLFINEYKKGQFKRISIAGSWPGITNGASYSDLDRDGDLDIVCNNLNETSYIIQNNNPPSAFISVELRDTILNRSALGTQVTLYQKNKMQYQYIHHLAGFQSGKESIAYFSLSNEAVDSIVIQWPDGNCQTVYTNSPGAHKVYREKVKNLTKCNIEKMESQAPSPLTIHLENAPYDIDLEKWMPYSLSYFGPRIATGSKYYYVTNAANHGTLHLTSNNSDVSNLIIGAPKLADGLDENDAAFADVNNDGLEDLMITIGGNSGANTDFQNVLFFIQQDGFFKHTDLQLPKSGNAASVIRPEDYDRDGDIDLFVGTLLKQSEYGLSSPSMLYINDGKGFFSGFALPVNEMVFDAQWCDIDQDGMKDLVLAGHWMPITILYNKKSKWEVSQIQNSEGLWFTIHVSDLNEDKIPDFIAGNFGLNNPLHADTSDPLILYIRDFDQNGQSDPMLSYVQDSKRYVYPNLELFLQILPGRKKDFVYNRNFAGKEINQVFSKNELDQADKKKCSMLSSGVFLSDPSFSWNFVPLPIELQSGPIWSICNTGDKGFVFGGNFYKMDPNLGRQDALLLSSLIYDSQNGWMPDSEGGIHYYRRSEIRDLKLIKDRLLIASNNDTLMSILLKK